MNDTHTIPASMVEAAARALWPIKAPRGVRFDQMHPTVRATVDAEARAVLAAALAECEDTDLNAKIARATLDDALQRLRVAAPKCLWLPPEISEDGCWLWVGPRDRDGYGRVTWKHRGYRAHRLVYLLLIGPIEPSYQLDHLCRVRLCVNPGHMEIVTAKVNTLRGNGLAARNARATSCRHGHPYDAENTYVDSRGSRHCRACSRLNQERFRRRARAAEDVTAVDTPAQEETAK